MVIISVSRVNAKTVSCRCVTHNFDRYGEARLDRRRRAWLDRRRRADATCEGSPYPPRRTSERVYVPIKFVKPLRRGVGVVKNRLFNTGVMDRSYYGRDACNTAIIRVAETPITADTEFFQQATYCRRPDISGGQSHDLNIRLARPVNPAVAVYSYAVSGAGAGTGTSGELDIISCRERTGWRGRDFEAPGSLDRRQL
jgi:hypothetical protein